MRWKNFVVLPSLLSLATCGPEEAVAVACPIATEVRLADAPDGFVPAEDTFYGLYEFGEDILYTFDAGDAPDREYWRVNRCTLAAEPYPSLAPGLHNPFTRETPRGRVVYANDDAGRPYLVDRLDEPGADEARPVAGLPDKVYFGSYSGDVPMAYFSAYGEGYLVSAAGIGAAPRSVYAHAGDPAVPAVLLGDRVIESYWYDDTHQLILEDGGEVGPVAQRVPRQAGRRPVDVLVRLLDEVPVGRRVSRPLRAPSAARVAISPTC